MPSTAEIVTLTGIESEQLSTLVDYSEQRARELLADGVSLEAALAGAADETIDLARALGMLPEPTVDETLLPCELAR